MTLTTLPLTIADETRLVDVYDVHGDGRIYATCNMVGAFRKRTGGKVWFGDIWFFKQADGSYKAMRTATFLNRSGYPLVAWADQIVMGTTSQHNSAQKSGR